MGREKSIPHKRKSLEDNSTSSEPFNCYNYRPVVKKRRSKGNKLKTENFYKVDLPNATNKDYFLGTLCIGSTNNALPDSYSNCKVNFKFSEENDADLLVLLCDITYVLVNCSIENNILKGKQFIILPQTFPLLINKLILYCSCCAPKI